MTTPTPAPRDLAVFAIALPGDRPRPIDRYIDYFEGQTPGARPAIAVSPRPTRRVHRPA
jgi:hypothetical protein